MLSFTLLGEATIEQTAASLTFRSKKEAALLFYLAHTGRAHDRERLADMLWDGRSTQESLRNLRTVLTRLRKQVGDALITTRRSVQLAPEAIQFVDSKGLLEALANVEDIHTTDQGDALRKELALYQGEFLSGFQLPEASQFDAWVTETREAIRRQAVVAYQKLVQCDMATQALEQGISDVRRWLAIDEWDETAHKMLIQLLVENDCKLEACQHYEDCMHMFQVDLGMTPPAEMATLVAETSPERRNTLDRAEHNLPLPYDAFFGRVEDRRLIHACLDQPHCRLITLTGMGGVGKTRLATTIARDRLNRYQDGIWIVDLDHLDADDPDPAEAIAVEIITSFSLFLNGTVPPARQLITYLRDQHLLLVLDNYEQLLGDGADMVVEILQRCEKVQIIATSREPLGIRGETVFPLNGLRYPRHVQDQGQFDAVDLFLARRSQRRWDAASKEELAAIRRICDMVAGLPLAIELAAGMTDHLTAQAIEEALHHSFDALETTLRDMPSRHRSLHEVFETSWRTLTPELQQLLARLAVFAGGFSEQAARAITAATRRQLVALCEKSLLIRDTVTNRFTLHPVIRAYADEKRSLSDPTLYRHGEYYLERLAEHTEALQASASDAWPELEPDAGNFRLAWQTALDQHWTDLLSDAFTAFAICHQHGEQVHEGELIMAATRRATEAWGDDGAELATRAELERARFLIDLGQLAPAIRTLEETVSLAHQNQDAWTEGLGYALWGEALKRLERDDLAEQKVAYARGIAQSLDAVQVRAWRYAGL